MTEELWFDSLQRQESDLSETSSLTLGCMGSYGFLSGIKRPERDAQQLSVPNAVIYEWSCTFILPPPTHTHTHLYGMQRSNCYV
jgi:hypothetical protein